MLMIIGADLVVSGIMKRGPWLLELLIDAFFVAT